MKYIIILISSIILFTNCETGKEQLSIKQQEKGIDGISVDAYCTNLNKDIIKEVLLNTSINSKDIKLDESVILDHTLYYEGSDIPSATMYFYKNGLLVLNSVFFSENMENYENRFFLWETFEDYGIKLTYIDNRIDFECSVKVAEYHLKNHKSCVYSIDVDNKQIVYGFPYDNGLFFGGFIFYPNK